ncbi:MAG: hydrogenase maturation protease [Verrucomicrobia bacterium]|nr:hydrogenase maturation protease [Verrucomicrobiota bacterium]
MPADKPILVIGYGNDLRQDDAVGPRLAQTVAQWHLPGVLARAVQQLTPDLAADLAHAQAAVFVDAAASPELDAVEVSPLQPTRAIRGLAHTSDPAALLAFTRLSFGACPPAWWVKIPAVQLGYGEDLSAESQTHLDDALGQVYRLIGRLQSARAEPPSAAALPAQPQSNLDRPSTQDPHSPHSPPPTPAHTAQTALELDFTDDAKPKTDGLERWRQDRDRALAATAEKLGLPLGRNVEVWLHDGVRLRGKLELCDLELFTDTLPRSRIGLLIDNVPFTLGDLESCVRLD